jgi:hypothetical protein
MSILTHKCPHCLTDHIGLRMVGYTAVAGKEKHFSVHLSCPKCYLPSGALMTLQQGRQNATGFETLIKGQYVISDHSWTVVDFWPAVPKPQIPELLPKDVRRVYLQAERNFPTEGNEEASGTMYRKALDIGLRKIDPSASGMLGPRIKKLAAAGKLTDDIAIWSDNIRDVGNDAAHEESALTRPELIALRSFSEMVLRYLFTLPAMVKKRRGEALEWETDDDSLSGAT